MYKYVNATVAEVCVLTIQTVKLALTLQSTLSFDSHVLNVVAYVTAILVNVPLNSSGPSPT